MACHCEGTGEVKCETINFHEKLPKKNTRFEDEQGVAPPFLPQATDYIAKPSKDPESAALTPPSYWATGRPIWSPTADLVGVRPVVDRYTITKYGPLDWRRNNLAVMESVGDVERLKQGVKCSVEAIAAKADKNQNDNAIRLQKKLQDIRHYQGQIESIILELREEIVLLTEVKVRLKYALPSLKLPESIVGECIDKRTCRMDPDLVKDDVEVELTKEMAMIYEIRELFLKALQDVDLQINVDKACKDELEKDWSDKKVTIDIEKMNVCLRNDSPNIAFKHGSTRVQHMQSTPETWENLCLTLVKIGSEELKKTRDLRKWIDYEVLTKPIEELKKQADKVTGLLKNRIEETDQCRLAFERQLQTVLQQIADTEATYEGSNNLLRQLDMNLKVAETRLDNRMYRPRAENCRDEVQYGLLDEVRSLNESKAAMQSQVNGIDLTLSRLYQTRADLEFQIMSKRKSLYIDQQRCMAYRDKYPDLSTLSGKAD